MKKKTATPAIEIRKSHIRRVIALKIIRDIPLFSPADFADKFWHGKPITRKPAAGGAAGRYLAKLKNAGFIFILREEVEIFRRGEIRRWYVFRGVELTMKGKAFIRDYEDRYGEVMPLAQSDRNLKDELSLR